VFVKQSLPIVDHEKRLKETGVADELFNGATQWHPSGGALPVRTPVRRRSQQTRVDAALVEPVTPLCASPLCRKLRSAQPHLSPVHPTLYKGNL
jgi:hypothetical protein